MIKVISAQKPNGLDKIMSLVKRVLIFNISNARNVFIRIPLKLCIIMIVLILRLIFKSDFKTEKPVKNLPKSQSSPASVSVLLESSQSIARNHASRTCLSNKFSTFSVIKSTSRSSLVNFFTPDCCLNETLNCMSDIHKNTDGFGKEEENSDLNDTELDCDSLDTSLYIDQKTEFSDSSINYFKKVSKVLLSRGCAL